MDAMHVHLMKQLANASSNTRAHSETGRMEQFDANKLRGHKQTDKLYLTTAGYAPFRPSRAQQMST